MSKLKWGVFALGFVMAQGAAFAQQDAAETAEAVPLEPMTVTPQTAAIEAMSQLIAAQLLQEQRWELPELQAPQPT